MVTYCQRFYALHLFGYNVIFIQIISQLLLGGLTMTIFNVLDTLIPDLPILREVHAKNAKFNAFQRKRLVPVLAL